MSQKEWVHKEDNSLTFAASLNLLYTLAITLIPHSVTPVLELHSSIDIFVTDSCFCKIQYLEIDYD